jgi:predicted negative regulator of RcsB-dependent stress response
MGLIEKLQIAGSRPLRGEELIEYGIRNPTAGGQLGELRMCADGVIREIPREQLASVQTTQARPPTANELIEQAVRESHVAMTAPRNGELLK